MMEAPLFIPSKWIANVPANLSSLGIFPKRCSIIDLRLAPKSIGYPKCKWYEWSCDKRNTQNFTKFVDPLFKDMTNTFVGAVNGMSIVVPYLGDYEVTAYDQYENVLGQITIREDDFQDKFIYNYDIDSYDSEGLDCDKFTFNIKDIESMIYKLDTLREKDDFDIKFNIRIKSGKVVVDLKDVGKSLPAAFIFMARSYCGRYCNRLF